MHAALEEFAGFGFHDGCLNRVVETAGISKGSMDCVEGTEDLSADLAKTELQRLFDQGPFPVPDGGDAETFSPTLEDYDLRSRTALSAAA